MSLKRGEFLLSELLKTTGTLFELGCVKWLISIAYVYQPCVPFFSLNLSKIQFQFLWNRNSCNAKSVSSFSKLTCLLFGISPLLYPTSFVILAPECHFGPLQEVAKGHSLQRLSYSLLSSVCLPKQIKTKRMSEWNQYDFVKIRTSTIANSTSLKLTLAKKKYTTRRLVHQPRDTDICDVITVGAISVKRLQRQNHDMWCYIYPSEVY